MSSNMLTLARPELRSSTALFTSGALGPPAEAPPTPPCTPSMLGNKMKTSHSFRLALVPGLIAVACLCWAASKPKQLSSYDPEAKALLARMTLEEKIGQMTQPEQNELKDPADVENYFVGSLLSGGRSDPKKGTSLKAWTDLYERWQARTRNTRLTIPILYGIAAVDG